MWTEITHTGIRTRALGVGGSVHGEFVNVVTVDKECSIDGVRDMPTSLISRNDA
jgi:hypothetical protein